MMMFRKIFLVVTALVAAPLSVVAQAGAEQNIMMGMQGLAEAAKDPTVLAQLMRDMADPEMMAAAKEMMADPAWQKEMKKLQGSKEFKESISKTKELVEDPNAAAHAEAKMEHMLKVGNDNLKNGAAAAMEEAMAAMNNPEMMAEMAKMAKDPNFKEQLAALSKDPQFQSYIEAMQDMMQDPTKKRKFEAAADSIRASL